MWGVDELGSPELYGGPVNSLPVNSLPLSVPGYEVTSRVTFGDPLPGNNYEPSLGPGPLNASNMRMKTGCANNSAAGIICHLHSFTPLGIALWAGAFLLASQVVKSGRGRRR